MRGYLGGEANACIVLYCTITTEVSLTRVPKEVRPGEPIISFLKQQVEIINEANN